MNNVLTFIIPVRHQENAANWEVIKSNLTETLKSIKNQDAPGWRAVVVANFGADLPSLPEGVVLKRVDFPPNPVFKIGSAPIEEVYEAVRSDKGRRILAGMLHMEEMGHIMLVDDDDLVSRRLTSFVAANPLANGFFFEEGYVWESGKKFLYHYDGNFSEICGTSHIVRSDLYEIPRSIETAPEKYIRRVLGSHRFVSDDLKQRGTPLSPLPFIGSIYRIGHSENHSRSNGILEKYIFRKKIWEDPVSLLRRVARLKLINNRLSKEYFGD